MFDSSASVQCASGATEELIDTFQTGDETDFRLWFKQIQQLAIFVNPAPISAKFSRFAGYICIFEIFAFVVTLQFNSSIIIN